MSDLASHLGSRARRRLRTERVIRQAALDLIAAKGLADWSLREVARSVGYSPAALYEYFASKEALLVALANEAGQLLADRLRAVPAERPPREHIVELGLAYLGFARTHPAYFRLVLSEFSGQRRAPEGEAPEAPAYQLLANAVDAGLASRALVAPSGQGRDSITYGLWALIHGAALLQLTSLGGLRADFTKVNRHSLETFLAGVSSPRV